VPILKRVNKDFFKKWNPDMAYVLGFFAADGYITLNKRGANFWCIQITDKGLLEKIKGAIQAEHKISMRYRGGNERVIYRLQIGSKEMCDDLRGLGMRENKTKSLVIPHVPKKYFADFARGYFDGDGNVWMGKVPRKTKEPGLIMMTMFTSCSAAFLEQLHTKLAESGLMGGSIYRSKENYSRLQYSTRDSLKLYDFMYNQLVFQESPLFLRRKKMVFERFIKLRS